MKYCPKCNKEKLPVMFWKSPNRRDGLRPYCIACCKKYYYPAILQYIKNRYKEDGDFRHKRIQYSKNRHQEVKNKEYYLEYQRQYYIKKNL